MAREAYVGLATGAFGALSRRAALRNAKLRLDLEQAHIGLLPHAFIALTWMNALLAGVLGYLVLGLALGLAAASGSALPSAPVLAVLLTLPPMLAAGVWVAQSIYPDYRAGERRRGIEANLPYAVNYIAAMSSAGIVPAAIFRDLARQRAYGEVAREFAWMSRDLDLFGLDFLSAVHRAIARTPSPRFQEFLQGAKTTIMSGGDLKTYFVAKAEQYMGENRRAQKEFLDGLAVLAESYVTVVIAGPLFMLVLLTVMMIIGRGAATVELFLFALVFMVLPVTHIAFTWIVRSVKPEV